MTALNQSREVILQHLRDGHARGGRTMPLDEAAAWRWIVSAVAMFSASERSGASRRDGATPVERRAAYEQLLAEIRAVERSIETLASSAYLSQPLLMAWGQAEGSEDDLPEESDHILEEARGSVQVLATWARLSLEWAVPDKGRRPGSAQQRLLAVLVGPYFQHTGHEPASTATDDNPFLALASEVAAAVCLKSEISGLGKALSKLKQRPDWAWLVGEGWADHGRRRTVASKVFEVGG